MNTSSAAVPPGRDGRRWLILFVGLIAMTAGCTFRYGIAYLIPALRQEGFSLELASVLVACPTIGLLLTLIAWGAAADRWGERVVLSAGLGLAGLILLAAGDVHGVTGLGVCLALAGAAGGSMFAASGRLILGWFARSERGLAMGIRQGAQPLGVAVAAVTLPTLGGGGPVRAAAVPGRVLPGRGRGRDPGRARPAPAGRGRARSAAGRLSLPPAGVVLIHAASALLVVSQFAVATFALVFLVDARHWDAVTAGRVLAIAQACGVGARLGAGWWSDRTGSRMRPMRILAVTTGVALLALAGAAVVRSPAAVVILLGCGVVAVSTNGLAATAIAEYAGSAWAGRALGVQNTGQNALAAATPPVLALSIGSIGFGRSFAVVALFPLAAAFVVPVTAESASARAGSVARARQVHAEKKLDDIGPGEPADAQPQV